MKNIINRIKNDKVLFFLSILIIGVFLVLVIRITYSYLAAYINEARENVTLGSDTTDEFKFIEGETIDLNVTSTTLPEGGGNYAQSTTYRAELTANSTNNTAEESYYVYFNVTANTLGYIQEGNPEVILTVFQGETEITNIDGLTYGTYNGVTGFDVTTATGMFTVASDYAITSNSSTTPTVQNWTFTLTYLNQNYDQSGNYGNNMNVEFIFSKKESEAEVTSLANYIIGTYTSDGVNGLYYHDADLVNGANDNSYRYSGANPSNYVCFGSNEATCPEDNLYRIIGIFNGQVKLIKSTNYENHYWNGSGGSNGNVWSDSTLNTTILNITYLDGLGTNWSSLIFEYSWQVGGITSAQRNSVPATLLSYEVGADSSNTTYNAKVGLMYISDYGFATSADNWGYTLDNSAITNDNWLYLNTNEWTITRHSEGTVYAFQISSAGTVSGGVVGSAFNVVRPVFYLNSNVTYVSGTGTESAPYRIA